MRKPDIHTYESWFLDFLEGNLSREEQVLLQEFLESHPLLAGELEEMSTEPLAAEPQTYPHSDKLLKSVDDLKGEAFDDYCIAAMEGDLDPEEQQAFLQSLNENNQKEQIFRQYQHTRLTAEQIEYPGKKELLKKQGTLRVLPWALPLAAAAAMLLFVLLPLSRNNSPATQLQTSSAEVVQEMVNPEESPIPSTPDPVPLQVAEIPARKEVNTHIPLPEKQMPAELAQTQIPVQTVQREMMAWAPLKSVDQINLSSEYTLLSGTLSGIPTDVLGSQPTTYLSLWRRVSKEFREFTHPESRVVSDEPLKFMEVADAGIQGINKLLGWNVDFRAQADDDQPDD